MSELDTHGIHVRLGGRFRGPESFEGFRLLHEHTLPAMRDAIRANHNQIFSPKEMRVILAALAETANL